MRDQRKMIVARISCGINHTQRVVTSEWITVSNVALEQKSGQSSLLLWREGLSF
jgi:hypothetical protein